MKCVKCGRELERGSYYCGYCGQPNRFSVVFKQYFFVFVLPIVYLLYYFMAVFITRSFAASNGELLLSDEYELLSTILSIVKRIIMGCVFGGLAIAVQCPHPGFKWIYLVPVLPILLFLINTYMPFFSMEYDFIFYILFNATKDYIVLIVAMLIMVLFKRMHIFNSNSYLHILVAALISSLLPLLFFTIIDIFWAKSVFSNVTLNLLHELVVIIGIVIGTTATFFAIPHNSGEKRIPVNEDILS